MSTEIDYVSEIMDLLNQLSEKIEADENIQFDDVSEIFIEIESLYHFHKMLEDPFVLLYKGIYDAKGAMSEVISEIQEMKDACLQQRCFDLLTAIM